MDNTNKVNTPYLRSRIIPALRSGEYQQGHGYLRQNDLYCCLGVMTDCAIKDGLVAGEWNCELKVFFSYGKSVDSEGISVLSTDVASVIGIEADGRVRGYSYESSRREGESMREREFRRDSLWQLNDIDRLSLAEIGTEIEKMCDWAEANGRARTEDTTSD